MAPERRYRRSRVNRWYRQHAHGGQQQEVVQLDTISGDRHRRVLDSYCPFCATDIRSVGPRNIVRCPNFRICGKILPVDTNSCPNCCHYTRPGDNFCRICRTNLRGVVRGHGGLYQQLGRAPSPFQNTSPPRQQPEPSFQPESEDEDEGSSPLKHFYSIGEEYVQKSKNSTSATQTNTITHGIISSTNEEIPGLQGNQQSSS